MTALEQVAGIALQGEGSRSEARSLWSRWLRGIMGSAQKRVRLGRARRVPVYRISRVELDCWIVERPDAVIEHAFPDLDQAVAFIRYESKNELATVELRISDLYVVAQLDPNQPASLFGEAVS